MPEPKEAVLLTDAQLKSMSNIQSTLLKGISDVAKLGGLAAKSWDKVTWGRSSSMRNDIGDVVTYKDDLSVALDPRETKLSE